MNELKKEFEREFGPCTSRHTLRWDERAKRILEFVEDMCGKEYLNGFDAGLARGAEKLEQAEKSRAEAAIKFFEEQKEIAQIRGDLSWVNEFDLQIKHFKDPQ